MSSKKENLVDEIEKKPASENPWYVLATLFGEYVTKDVHHIEVKETSDINRKYWNAWASQGMTDGAKSAIKDAKGKSILDDAPEWDSVRLEVEEKFKARLPKSELPKPSLGVNFYDIIFNNDIYFSDFFFPGDVNFKDTKFSGDAHFSNTKFFKTAEFNNAEFSGDAHFFSAEFYGDYCVVSADFTNAKFSGDAHFSNTKFFKTAEFNNAEFSGGTSFQSAKFSKYAMFRRAEFSGDVNFISAEFSGDVNFFSANFSGGAIFSSTKFFKGPFFSSANFSGNANFHNSKFSGLSIFISAEFNEEANFSDAVFDSPCNFRDTHFKKYYPDLSGTLLHSKTILTSEDIYWPKKVVEKSNDDETKAAFESCALLRQNMTSQGLFEAAHFFFRREMAHKAELSKLWERPFYVIYRWVEYGYGVKQPLVGIVLLWAAGILLLIYDGFLPFTTALGLSAANIFKFFGFQGAYYGGVIESLSSPLQFMTVAQTVIGYLLLFLLGLGLRNRFRMK